MSLYKDKLECREYIPQCVLDELERLNQEIVVLNNKITKLQHCKVDRTPIAPERNNEPQIVTDQEYKDAVGECPLGLPDPPPSHNN
jgi:rRNA-processing protein FCF1